MKDFTKYIPAQHSIPTAAKKNIYGMSIQKTESATSKPEVSINDNLYNMLFNESGKLSRSQYMLSIVLTLLVIPLLIVYLIKHRSSVFMFKSKRKIAPLLLILFSIVTGALQSLHGSLEILSMISFILILITSFATLMIIIVQALVRFNSKRLADIGSTMPLIDNAFIRLFLGLLGSIMNFIYYLVTPGLKETKASPVTTF